jgi:hypothetical protein
MGRPSEYRPEYVEQAEKLSLLGATDIQIADFFGVDESTICRWKHTHPDFCKSIKLAKEIADTQVERSLYNRARGYSVDTVKVFCNKDGEVTQVPVREHFPPDATSLIFWLKNRKPKEWRDKSEVEIPGLNSIAEVIAKARKRAGKT